MSVLYCSTTELSQYMNVTVTDPRATLLIQVASQLFSTRADTMFNDTTVTYQAAAWGQRELFLPYKPISAVSQVRIINAISGTTILTGWTRIKSVLYYQFGFGIYHNLPPDMIEVDLTYGYSAPGDDVKGAVMETAGAAYLRPDVTTKSESLDDYSVSYSNVTGVMLSPSAQTLADMYRGTVMA